MSNSIPTTRYAQQAIMIAHQWPSFDVLGTILVTHSLEKAPI